MTLKRIVLVEDNPHDLFLVKEALRARSIEAELTCFSDIPEALSALRDDNFPTPDAVLLDLNLPRGEGVEVLETVRHAPRMAGVPVAVLTSSESPRDRDRASRLGISAYIIKPVELDAFFENVGSAVERLLSPRVGVGSSEVRGSSR
ncbi:MAG: response regulator [Candidatus Hydrogenedentes bacterium]|nr:response regulator [Candidatus Hydrogenedentota bacterium]